MYTPFLRLTVLTAISAMSLVAISLPAYADDSQTDSSRLLPLEAQEITHEVDSGRLESVADEINASTHPKAKGAPNIADIIGADFIDDFVDEDGDVNLPLGLTVFSSMGTTSIGFGGDF